MNATVFIPSGPQRPDEMSRCDAGCQEFGVGFVSAMLLLILAPIVGMICDITRD